LFDDPHLLASGGLAELTLENGTHMPVPLLPLLLDGRHLNPRMPLPKVGEHNSGLLAASAKNARQASSRHLSKTKRKVSR
jgi:crotonobetainyl-CoA:carnitine CoA-transferase CaiB-like acyl-CoA transferase